MSESASRFFLRNGVPLVTTGVRRDRDGDSEGWGAAIEQPVIAALEAACRTHRLRLAAVLPTLAVISHALHGDSLTWDDGEVCAHVTLSEGRLTSVRRTLLDAAAPVAEHDGVPLAVLGATALGADGWRFADAYGAAVTSVRDPLAYRPARAANTAPIPTRRLVAAGIPACALALAAAILAPALTARYVAAQATGALAALARQRRAVEAAESDLVHVSRALDEVAAFDSDRHPATLLVNDLARALPVGGALVTLRVDSAGGTLVALAPCAAILIERLEHVPGLTTPTFVGPVTREVANSEVERVAIHFSWARVSARPPVRATSAETTP